MQRDSATFHDSVRSAQVMLGVLRIRRDRGVEALMMQTSARLSELLAAATEAAMTTNDLTDIDYEELFELVRTVNSTSISR